MKTTMRRQTTGWLLCIVVTAFALFPSQCRACDGIAITHQAVFSNHIIAPTNLSSIDTCDGACSCCLLQILPIQLQVEVAHKHIAKKLVADTLQPALNRYSSIFRPPRIFSVS